jgi:hypothetical protein
VSISLNHWIQWICREVKCESPSTFAISGDIEIVRYKGTRVIDLALEFRISEVGIVEEVMTRRS